MLLNTSTAAQPLMFIHCHVTDIIRLFSPSMGFLRLVFLPVLADFASAPTTFRTSLSKPYRLAPFNVRKFRLWLNSAHPIFELRNVSRREILIKFHNFNIRSISHPKNFWRECSCSGSDDTYLILLHQYFLSSPIINITTFFIELTMRYPPLIWSAPVV